ncbi:MAG: tetratricopeptide repeat protein [Candidatus Kapabacteria bacterium]|nr:tetratricopeptide repeat protein [Candidatus Kapabacteria bacterium]
MNRFLRLSIFWFALYFYGASPAVAIEIARRDSPNDSTTVPEEKALSLSKLSMTPDSLVQYGIRQMDSRKYVLAQEAFEEAVKLDALNCEAHCRLCQMEIVQGKNLEKAEEYCLKAIHISPKNADYYYWLGAVYGLQALNGELIDALAVASRLRDAFQKALKINPKHANARFAMAQYYLQAPPYAGGSIKEARRLALEAMPFDELTARRILASVYRVEKKPAAAEDEYRRAVESDRKNVEVLNEFAVFYINEKRYNEAIECYERALALDTTNMFVLQGLGDVFTLQNRYDEASAMYQKSLSILPRHTSALMGLARLNERQKNKPEAIKYYTLAAKCDPKSKLGKEALRRLREIKREKL